MEEKNSIHPQDGNQVVIGTNSGTIHIHNSSDTDLLKSVVRSQSDFNESLHHFVNIIEKLASTANEIMKTEQKKKSKKK